MLNIMENSPKGFLSKEGNFVFEEITIDPNEFVSLVTNSDDPFVPLPINELGKKLLQAVQDGDVDQVRVLMTKGAPFTTDWLGTSPLHLAAQNNHLTLCEMLLNAGMCKDARTKVDRTPLHMAAYFGHLEIVDCLLKHDAEVDAKDLLHMTPLHWAVQNGHAEIAACLIRDGASVNVVNNFNLTPLDIATQLNRSDIVQILKFTISKTATRHLTMELNKDDDSSDAKSVVEILDEPITILDDEVAANAKQMPLETVLIDDNEEESTREESEEAERNLDNETIEAEGGSNNASFSESFKLLQEHGITMLPLDNSNILNTVMETGHSVVLTEAGKQALNSIKSEMQVQKPLKPVKKVPLIAPAPSRVMKKKKIITVTSDQFLAMTANNGANNLRIINGKIYQQNGDQQQQIKRVVLRKTKPPPNKRQAISSSNTAKSATNPTIEIQNEPTNDIELLIDQLGKAQQLVESYKERLAKSELEVAKYKQRCRVLLQSLKNLT